MTRLEVTSVVSKPGHVADHHGACQTYTAPGPVPGISGQSLGSSLKFPHIHTPRGSAVCVHFQLGKPSPKGCAQGHRAGQGQSQDPDPQCQSHPVLPRPMQLCRGLSGTPARSVSPETTNTSHSGDWISDSHRLRNYRRTPVTATALDTPQNH